jgi:DNA-binding NarL/FixJ family response regulator
MWKKFANSPHIQEKLNHTLQKITVKSCLPKRELEILIMIADGLAQKQITSELKISTHTVTEYIHNIYK